MKYPLLGCFLAFSLAASAQEPATESLVAQLGTIAAQTIALEAEQAREERAWRDDQTLAEDLMRILALRRDRLAGERAKLLADASRLDQEQEKLLASRRQTEKKLDAMNRSLDHARQEISLLLGQLPPELRDELGAQSAPDEETGRPVARLRILLAQMDELAQLLQTVSIRSMVFTTPDGASEWDVLYLGGSLAYALHRDGKQARTGSFHGGEWRWTDIPEHAAAIGDALRVARRETPPRLVRLPIPSSFSGRSP